MFSDLEIFYRASEMSRHAALRQRLIAENIANADTPRFRARDLEPFSIDPECSFTPRATRVGHIVPSDEARWHAREVDVSASPDGNTSVLEDQLLRAADAEGQQRLAMTVYSKAIDLLRAGLGRVQ